MAPPSVDFLIRCLVAALLDYYCVDQPPVPVRRFVSHPPPDLTDDFTLVEVPGFPFPNAVWVRLHTGQGGVFVDANIPALQRRFVIARALFIGLCLSKGGRAIGLENATRGKLHDHATRFGRHLLMPLDLLPEDWESMPAKTLAQVFEVPVEVAETRVRELKGGLAA